MLSDPRVCRYGGLAVAAQRSVRGMQELVDISPADGLVGGLAEVWGQPVVVAAYDYTVFAGTQGAVNHKKQDRLFCLAAARALPVVLFAEGGGGRPGDVDLNHSSASQLDVPTFAAFARLHERVPLVVARPSSCHHSWAIVAVMTLCCPCSVCRVCPLA
jgi:acetyl-CoA carboxylase carboxyltransferase component